MVTLERYLGWWSIMNDMVHSHHPGKARKCRWSLEAKPQEKEEKKNWRVRVRVTNTSITVGRGKGKTKSWKDA